MAIKDYYEILEISRDCPEAGIKKAFRNLAMLYHPDKNIGNPYAAQHFREIQEAYQVLSNPIKRSEYDQKRWQVKGGNNRFTSASYITPDLLLQEIQHLKKEISQMDEFRMDHFALSRTLEQLLNDQHRKLLLQSGRQDTNKKLVLTVLTCLRPMPYLLVLPIAQKLAEIAESDNELINGIHAFVKEKRRQYLWEKYRGIVMISIALILSYLIYLLA
mgnify:CR=1 FL=1